jgi:transcription-repair coupling factor (superfamily II helicase)
MSEPLQRVLQAEQPLTLSGVPTGFLPWLAADLARGAHGSANGGRAVIIAADEAAMRALADTVPLFAPEVQVVTFPGWDCLPYDRASPALRVMAERLSALNALQSKREAPQLLVATASAASQRVLTPFRIRQLTRRVAQGDRIDRDALIGQLNALGYERTDTVADHGEYAVRGSLIDLFPAGEELALRLDFFGDEIDSIRRFDPADQRSTDKAEAFLLTPASEALIDADGIERFRSRYRETFGATATQDPLYQALSAGRRLAGMEHWLPLIEEQLATLFDHLGERTSSSAIRARTKPWKRGARRSRTITRTVPGRWRPSREATVRSSHGRFISRRKSGTQRPRNGRSTSLRRSRKRNRNGRSTSGSSPRATSRPNGPGRRMSMKPSPSMSRRCARADKRSCWRATLRAHASACRACSKNMV